MSTLNVTLVFFFLETVSPGYRVVYFRITISAVQYTLLYSIQPATQITHSLWLLVLLMLKVFQHTACSMQQ